MFLEAALLSAAIVRSVSIPGTQMNVRLATQVGRPFDAATLSEDIRTLWKLGRFSDIRAEAEHDQDGVDVIFHVVAEPRYSLREVRLEPHAFGLQAAVEPGTLFTRAQAAHTAAKAREQLVRRGYTSAKVGWRFSPAPHGAYDLVLTAEPGSPEHGPKRPPMPAAPRAVCACLFQERREAERRGIIDFSASLDESGTPVIRRGKPYTLGRLTLYGHHHYSDALIRSQFLLDEGAPLDLSLLRRSLTRLNQAALFEPVDERRVQIATDDKTGVANLIIYLTERKRRAWNLSGPVPLAASISARVVATYGLSFNLLAYPAVLKLAANKRLLPVISLDRAFTPGQGWKSGLSFAPQFGWRGSLFGYASAQFRQRILPCLAGTRSPDLVVAAGGKTLLCRYPKPRFAVARTGAAMVLSFAGQFTGL